MKMFWAKSPTGRLVEGAAWALDLAMRLGLVAGAVIAAAMGQIFLGGVLALVALGVFLRFKRRRLKSRKVTAE